MASNPVKWGSLWRTTLRDTQTRPNQQKAPKRRAFGFFSSGHHCWLIRICRNAANGLILQTELQQIAKTALGALLSIFGYFV